MLLHHIACASSDTDSSEAIGNYLFVVCLLHYYNSE